MGPALRMGCCNTHSSLWLGVGWMDGPLPWAVFVVVAHLEYIPYCGSGKGSCLDVRGKLKGHVFSEQH